MRTACAALVAIVFAGCATDPTAPAAEPLAIVANPTILAGAQPIEASGGPSDWIIVYQVLAAEQSGIGIRTLASLKAPGADALLHVVRVPVQAADGNPSWGADNPGPDASLSAQETFDLASNFGGAGGDPVLGVFAAFSANQAWTLSLDMQPDGDVLETRIWRGNGTIFSSSQGTKGLSPFDFVAQADLPAGEDVWALVEADLSGHVGEDVLSVLPATAHWEVTGATRASCSEDLNAGQGWRDSAGVFKSARREILSARLTTTGDVMPPTIRSAVVPMPGLVFPPELRDVGYCGF